MKLCRDEAGNFIIKPEYYNFCYISAGMNTLMLVCSVPDKWYFSDTILKKYRLSTTLLTKIINIEVTTIRTIFN